MISRTIAKAVLAAALVTATAAPAVAAEWRRVDTVYIKNEPGRDVATPNFGGAVKALRLTAGGGNASCSSVTARFADGSKWQIFSGRLRSGAGKVIDVPGNRRQVTKLTFNCRSSDRHARIVVHADVAGYRTNWVRNSFWKRTWGL